jgi:hypothetical protein
MKTLGIALTATQTSESTIPALRRPEASDGKAASNRMVFAPTLGPPHALR